jgi:aminopeptidase YwaD
MRNTQVILLVLFMFFPISCKVYKYTPDITGPDLHRHMETLASDALQGRMPGTGGDEKAGAYIESRFKDLKLDTHRQVFSFLQAVKRGPDNFIEISGRPVASTLFAPFPFSRDTLVIAQTVFAGYGITVKTDSFEWNDYAGIDVKGKWVMVLRGSPDIPEASEYLSIGSDDRDKAMLANDNGAAGILFVSGVDFEKDDHLVTVSVRQAPVGIPALHISRALADSILRVKNTAIKDIESDIKSTRRSVAHSIGIIVKARSDIDNVTGQTCNWYAIIEGADPVLKEEYLVVGAHYDHLGMGGPGSSSRRPDTIAVHNGADDNASGVSAMLELAGSLNPTRAALKDQ